MKLVVETGELGEGMHWEYHARYDGLIHTYESRALDREYGYRMTGEFADPALPCPHAQWTGDTVPKYRHDGSQYGVERPYSVPEAAVCFNECGHNLTVLCLKCCDEARRICT